MRRPGSAPVSRRDRPAKPPLTRTGIVSVAMRILEEEGLERVTMRRLAQELDTGPASLYVYVSNVAELHGAILDELLDGIDLDSRAASDEWRPTLIALLVAYTRLLYEHSSLATSLLALRPNGPRYLRLIDAIVDLLRAGGVPANRAAWGVDLLLQHATATAAEQGTRRVSDPGHQEHAALALAIREAPPKSHPGLAWARDELFTGTGDQRLTWAFETLVTGIASGPAPGWTRR